MVFTTKIGGSRFILASVISLAIAPIANAQVEDSAIRFESPDGVKLRGHFFAGNKKSACVLFLHELGELRHEKPWRQFAQTLHKEGFAVLQFHFRGHGRSTEVDPDIYWNVAANRNLVKSTRRDEIRFDQFNTAYHQFLINDIAAAKSYLDRKNDEGECNSSNLILVSCGRSGALAAAWINSEMHRFRELPRPFAVAPIRLAENPEGENVLGAVFINAAPKIGKRKVSLAGALKGASQRYKLPFVFICGAEDSSAAAFAKDTLKAIDPEERSSFSGVTEIPDADAEGAEKRIATDVETQKRLTRYFKKVQEERGRDWLDRDSTEALFYWRNPNVLRSLIPYNQAANRNPPFASYDLFLPTR